MLAIADLTDGVYKLRLQSPSYVLAAHAVTGRLGHRRLAHIDSQDMNKMKNGIVDGLSYDVGSGEDVKGYRLYNPTKNNIITSRDVIVMEGETGDIATNEEAIWIPNEERIQESLETPEVSVEQESSISVGEICVPEVDDQGDSSSDSSVYTDGEDTLHECPPSKDQVQEVQTTSVPEPEHSSEEISILEALEGPEKEQWRHAMADELQLFENNEAWELVKNPGDVSIVKCR
ncbi:Retrovirus-related Pol polyprotein from transposon TNT 1-94 [Eumeta japonica]|uniref:Retrovirus-related Pol polyprotein from transposon TNT 1-94 n=1 Tax=Eumeta variegata TaxID=151549 RepID=A0A4C1UKS0_EUMVA|nr:Retrovirus-related Pol polyprotein from transposon TNT 1-94 [Eumeta japonica]